jgi:acetyltransferase-like isoleucine patch superfamily enzyme
MMLGDWLMILRGLLKKLIKKRTFLCDKTVKIYPTARIINNSKKIDAIKIGGFSHIQGELLTFGVGGNIEIGHHCFIGEGTKVWSAHAISIGDRVIISHCVNIFDNITHPLDPRKRHFHFNEIINSGNLECVDLEGETVFIENDVWIGCMSIILRGVTLGEGAVIGAGSVVTEDVPPYTVVCGNPARAIREIAKHEQ